jgi:glucosyl-3-phosphoglycerate synthase
MGDFFQNGVITTLHALGSRDEEALQREIYEHTRSRPLCLVLPSLYSELKGEALARIVEELKGITYLHRVVVSLGEANEAQFKKAVEYFKVLPFEVEILWNDGPRIAELKQQMRESKLYLGQPGKGLAAWMAYGYALADSEVRAVALHDCDIKTYSKVLLHRLVYPIVNPDLDYEFCKGYYARVTDTLHGRVTRIFVTPLVRALITILGHTSFLTYLDSFRYPLAGEFAMNVDVARLNRIPADWGLEVGTLAEVHRNYSNRRVCQVDLDIEYEHKHQETSIDAPKLGLMRMAREIALAVFNALAGEGALFSREFFNTLSILYLRCAQDAIRQYNDLAAINGLTYDRHMEDVMAEAFTRSLESASREFLDNPLGNPQIPNWSRVRSAMPDVLDQLREAVEKDNRG